MVEHLPRLGAAQVLPGRGLLLGLLFGSLVPGLWLVASFAVAYRLTRRLRPVVLEPVPALAWGKLMPLRLRTRDGQELGAWLIPGREDGPSVLLLHQYWGSRSASLGRARLLVAHGCTALMVTLRAHGDSTGKLNDIGYGARHDVIAAVDFLEQWRPGQPIIILGSSLGSAAAVYASGELGHRVHGYVLECPYQDLKTALRNSTKYELPPVLDWIAYRGLLSVSPLLLPELEKLSPITAIEGIPPEVPVLILAGGRDRRTPPEEAMSIYNRVRSHGRLVLFEHAGHLNFLETDPYSYEQFVIGFIRSVVAPSRPH
jgi:pimeloyl-ACP methyl ester carboxylesterase